VCELELADDESERMFLEKLSGAAEAAKKAPGLIELQASKVVGSSRTYITLSLWETEVHLEAWYNGPLEREMVRRAKTEMVNASRMKRFVQMGPEQLWERK